MEFKIPRRMREIRSRVCIQYFSREAFSLFRELVDRITWEEAALNGKGAQEGWEGHHPNTIMVHPGSQENKQTSQEANMTKQGIHGGTPMEKKRQYTRSWSREMLLRSHLEALLRHAGMVLRKLQLSCSWNLLGISRTTRRASSTAIVLKSWTGTKQAQCWKGSVI